MDSKDIRPNPNEKFLERLSEFANGGMDRGGEWPESDGLTDPTNMQAEGLFGSNEETPYDGENILQKGPATGQPLNKSRIPGQDRSELDLSSLGLQEERSRL